MRVQAVPMALSLYGRNAVSAKQSNIVTQYNTDSIEISKEAQAVITQKGQSDYPQDYFPAGFPDDIKQKMIDLKKSGTVDDQAMGMLEMTLIGIPMLEYAYNKYGPSGSAAGGDVSDIYTKGGYDLKKHIARMINDTEQHVNRGEGGETTKELLTLLNGLL